MKKLLLLPLFITVAFGCSRTIEPVEGSRDITPLFPRASEDCILLKEYVFTDIESETAQIKIQNTGVLLGATNYHVIDIKKANKGTVDAVVEFHNCSPSMIKITGP